MDTKNTISPLGAWGCILTVIGAVATVGFWDQGRRHSTWLDEQEPRTASVSAKAVDQARDGELIHVQGAIEPRQEEYQDPLFGVSARGLMLARISEEYVHLPGDGGGDRWMPTASAPPGAAGGVDAPPCVFWSPAEVRLGAFTLAPEVLIELLRQITGVTPPPAQDNNRQEIPWARRIQTQILQSPQFLPLPDDAALPAEARADWHRTPDGLYYYRGVAPDAPRLGDRRVSYRLVVLEPADVTVLALQRKGRLEAYPNSGGNLPLLQVAPGRHNLPAMFRAARAANSSQATYAVALCLCLLAAGLVLLFFTFKFAAWPFASGQEPVAAPAGNQEGAVAPPDGREGEVVKEVLG
jgi:hypothetical protein